MYGLFGGGRERGAMSGRYEGGRGRAVMRRGAQPSQQLHERPTGYIGFRRLQQWAGLQDNPAELIVWMTSNAPELIQFLNSPSISHDSLLLLMTSLKAVLRVKVHHLSFGKLIDVLTSTRFYDHHILEYLRQNNHPGSKEVTDTILKFIYETADKAPDEVNNCRNTLVYIHKNYESLSCDVQLLNDAVTAYNSSSQVKERKEKHRLRKWKHSDEPPDDIRNLSIFPTRQDLDADIEPFLRANKVQGAYRDKDHYLDVQFRLMREDFIQPLREGITDFREENSTASAKSDMLFYTDVKIVGLNVFGGIEHILLLNLNNLGGVRLDAEKRLIFGSLICLSYDHFRTIIYATVTQQDRDELKKKGLLRVKFQNCLEDVYGLSCEVGLTMTENPSFFEAYRHVLEGLQEMVTTPLPMEEYIVKCHAEIAEPEYVSHHTCYDLNCLKKKDVPRSSYLYRVLKPQTWPQISRLCLNDRQLEAVTTALTQELALLQGPPGTGKTYVGLKLMNVLLNNISNGPHTHIQINKGPILVVCYTNHALDQFLEGMLPFCKDGIVRVGGRSTCAALSKFNLQELRMKQTDSMSTRNCIKDCHREMDEIGGHIETLSQQMQMAHLEILNPELLKDCVQRHHYQTLLRTASSKGRNAMNMWLNSTSQSFDDHLKNSVQAHLVSLIVKGKETCDEKHVMMHLSRSFFVPRMTRVLVYRYWMRQVYENSVSLDFILNDDILYDVIPSRIYQHIRQRNASVKDWVLGQTVDEMLSVIEAIQKESPGSNGQVFDNTDEYERVHRQRVFEDEGSSDDETDIFAKRPGRATSSSSIPTLTRAKMLGVNLITDLETSQESRWQTAQKPLPFGKVIRKLQLTQPMSAQREGQVTDVWQLRLSERYQLYKLWTSRYVAKLNSRIRPNVEKYEKILQQKMEVRNMQTVDILKNAQVIGLTTTGAAKHRKTLQAVGPPIVVVEEAAEVFEAHIITALSQYCQHLILIGDHQQLRPKPEVYQLAKQFGLEVSLFERLINNGIRHVQLTEQHRMRPDISRFMKHIYPNLVDSDSVQRRPDIKGMTKNVFFIQHNEPESTVKNSKSKQNSYEARYLVRLCEYLIHQGYSDEDITILGTYGGQVTLIKELIANSKTRGIGNVRVSTVDNFQGEQNTVILLSLVRSNSNDKVGFLSTDNRVCVALSRAQCGMYVIGDIELLSRHSDLWLNVKKTAAEQQCLGEVMQLQCRQHAQVTEIRSISDFDKVPSGGCGLPCKVKLSCKHECPYLCHAIDHERITCQKPCERTCAYGHMCRKKCSEKCPPCKQVCGVTLTCGHTCRDLCHGNPKHHKMHSKCDKPCERTCPAGHKCPQNCSEPCLPCKERCAKELPCGHICLSSCHVTDHSSIKCKQPCRKTCSAGHQCTKKCSEPCERCRQPCGTKLPCGHTCPYLCHGNDHSWIDCDKPCQKTCRFGHKCPKKCHESCSPCEEPCRARLPCGHIYLSLCHDKDHSSFNCDARCLKTCPSGHRCPKKCSEPCSPCEQPCSKTCRAGHKCPKKCSEACSPCKRHCRVVRDCGHVCLSRCLDMDHKFHPACSKPCEKTCLAKHPCPNKCSEPCTPCSKQSIVKFTLLCGHTTWVKCHQKRPEPSSCSQCSSQRLTRSMRGLRLDERSDRYRYYDRGFDEL